jgi:hypothetical protein
MNEYTFQIWGKIFSINSMTLMFTEVVIAKDGVEAMRQAKKLAGDRCNYWEIRDFRKL